MPNPIPHAQILGSEESTNDVLFVLFIPSKDKDGMDLIDQDVWANAAGDMLSELFGGATIMPPAKGKWLNEDSQTIITEEIVLVHSYARGIHANNEDVIKASSSTGWGRKQTKVRSLSRLATCSTAFGSSRSPNGWPND